MGWLQRLFANWMKPAWKGLANALAMPNERTRHRLKGLQELEDRCLLSVSPLSPEFRVNTHTAGAQQTFPQAAKAVAMNRATGDFVAVWSSQGQTGAGSDWNVYAQRYNAAGAAQG